MFNVNPVFGQLMVFKVIILLLGELIFCRNLPRRENFPVRVIFSTIICLAIGYIVPIDFAPQVFSGSVVFLFHMFLSMSWLGFNFVVNLDTLLFVVSAGKVATSVSGLVETAFNLVTDDFFKIDSIFTVKGLFFYGRSVICMLIIFPIIYFIFGKKYKRWQLDRKWRPILWLIFVFVFITDILIYFIFASYVENTTNVVNIALYRSIEIFMQIFIMMLLHFIYLNSEMKSELDSVNALWSRAQQHYDLTKDTIDAINRKCHDLKHRILEIKAKSPDINVDDIYRVIDIYDSRVKTGNEVLDVILAEKNLLCADKKIHIECMADGSGLGFMEKTDLFILFGNIADNCIEAVDKIEGEQRFILMNVISKEGFIFINASNPYIGKLSFKGSLPITTKGDTENHGYGMLSIETVVKRYSGEMIISTDNNMFELKIVIPVPRNK